MINYFDYFRKDGTQDRELIEMLNRAYQQGRAEAIEELLSKCEQYNYTCNSREFAKVIREQLKEQK